MLGGLDVGSAVKQVVNDAAHFTDAMSIIRSQFSSKNIWLLDEEGWWSVTSDDGNKYQHFPTFAQAFGAAIEEFVKAVKGNDDES